MADELTGDNWDRAMRGLSDIELNLIMVGAKRGTLRAVGEPNNAMLAGFKAAKELVRRNSPPVPNKGGR